MEGVEIKGVLCGEWSEGQATVIKVFRLNWNEVNKEVEYINYLSIFDPLLHNLERHIYCKEHTFTIHNLPPGYYSLFAYEDVSGDGTLSSHAKMGWYGSHSIGMGRLGFLDLNAQKASLECSIPLYHSHPFQFPKAGKYGSTLKQQEGYAVMHLKGNAEERAYDHGLLAAHQIMDMFRFYLLSFVPAQDYLSKSQQAIQEHLKLDEHFKLEGNALLRGMKDAVDSLHIAELGRDFSLLDLLALNAYLETIDMARCTQFVAWGSMTPTGDAIAGRNMDGEIDIRKVTVTHLTLFAIDPTEKEQKKWISVMWPGFLGTLSAINETGLYAMMNCGTCAQGAPVHDIQPVPWTLRHVISSLHSEDVNPDSIQDALSGFKCSGGGISQGGAVFVFLRKDTLKEPAFVYEGDKYSGQCRKPGLVSPKNKDCIIAANHFLQYGVENNNESINFGIPVSAYSVQRYNVGRDRIQALARCNVKIDIKEMKILLQNVSRGITEHSIIFTPSSMEVYISNGLPGDALWDAPYLQFTKFTFSQLFN